MPIHRTILRCIEDEAYIAIRLLGRIVRILRNYLRIFRILRRKRLFLHLARFRNKRTPLLKFLRSVFVRCTLREFGTQFSILIRNILANIDDFFLLSIGQRTVLRRVEDKAYITVFYFARIIRIRRDDKLWSLLDDRHRIRRIFALLLLRQLHIVGIDSVRQIARRYRKAAVAIHRHLNGVTVLIVHRIAVLIDHRNHSARHSLSGDLIFTEFHEVHLRRIGFLARAENHIHFDAAAVRIGDQHRHRQCVTRFHCLRFFSRQRHFARRRIDRNAVDNFAVRRKRRTGRNRLFRFFFLRIR